MEFKPVGSENEVTRNIRTRIGWSGEVRFNNGVYEVSSKASGEIIAVYTSEAHCAEVQRARAVEYRARRQVHIASGNFATVVEFEAAGGIAEFG